MNFKVYFLSIVTILNLLSCQSDSGTYATAKVADVVNEEKYQLVKYKTYDLPLDYLSALEGNNSICYFERDGKRYLSTFNKIVPSIDVYDYSSGKLVNRVNLQKEGPNGIGKIDYNSAHFTENTDSIFILNNWTFTLYLLNSQGELLDKISLGKRKDDLLYNFYAFSSNPIKKYKSDLYIPVYPMNVPSVNFNYTKIPTVVKIDVVSSEIDELFYYPETYNQSFWGDHPFKYYSNFIFHPESNEFIVNYAIDPHFYRVKNNTVIGKYPIKSSYIESIEPYSETSVSKLVSQNNFQFSEVKDREVALTNSDFNYLLFDESLRLYILMAYVRPSVEQYKASNGDILPKSTFIIFNEDLQKVGETLIDNNNFYSDVFFYNNDGLHIAQRGNDHEESATFSVFRISEK